MKTIGLLGGTTWVSTIDYYRIMNQEVNKRLGANHTARILMYSINFEDAVSKNRNSDYEGLKELVLDSARRIEKGGADFLVLGANTLHLFAEDVQQEINIPLMHIAEKVSEKVLEINIKKIALLGTRITMTKDFYKNKLTEEGIETIIPDEEEMDFINYSIYEELGHNIFKESTKKRYLEIMNRLNAKGAEGFVLGCTEIPLIIKKEDSPHILFDTLNIHAKAAVEYALEDEARL